MIKYIDTGTWIIPQELVTNFVLVGVYLSEGCTYL